ncbi:MAG: hypothetical protein RIS94_2791 [Pseudomonadota bacterium]|jgi:uncharacterized repeat protein (TIGR01451 family)
MGAVVAAALALLPGVASAACDTANQYTFSYAARAAATLAYGTTYTYTATSGSGATRTFTVNVSQNGLSSTQVNTTQMPMIGTLVTGATSSANALNFGGTFSSRTASMTGTTRVIVMTVTFSQPVRDFALTAFDIDYTLNQFRDWVQVTGSDGTNTYTPALSTPWGNGNGATQPRTATSSSLTSGATTTPVTLTSSQVAGTGASGNNSDTGTLYASFAQPVTSITFKYGNYPLTGTETTSGQQAIGIGGFSFCPMPALALTKTSAPASGTLGAYNIPGNDVIYTLSLANSGGSPVDAGTVVLTDTLPAGVTFRNNAFDGTTSLPVKVVSAGGTSLGAADITYSKVGDATFTYTPASGYDPQVDAIRIAPTGALAANSTLQVQFAAQVR